MANTYTRRVFVTGAGSLIATSAAGIAAAAPRRKPRHRGTYPGSTTHPDPTRHPGG